MANDTLRLSVAQYNIAWEDKESNLSKIKTIVESLAGKTDLVILPEMCTTGFSLNAVKLGEDNDGETISTLKRWAKQYDIAICGSHIATSDKKNYNRGFFISSKQEYYYDKKHLFTMGQEAAIYSAGENNLIVEHKGFNICLLICYDLRFPVWARIRDNNYDLLIYTASWPKVRIDVWNTLLKARAIENMCYVCGVNRIGVDGMKLDYNGSSKLVDARGQELIETILDREAVETVEIRKSELEDFRAKFPVWKDADKFDLR